MNRSPNLGTRARIVPFAAARAENVRPRMRFSLSDSRALALALRASSAGIRVVRRDGVSTSVAAFLASTMTDRTSGPLAAFLGPA